MTLIKKVNSTSGNLFDSLLFSAGIDELEIRKGDIICVLRMQQDEWWYGHHINDPARRGYFPSNYVRVEDAGRNGNQGKKHDLHSVRKIILSLHQCLKRAL